jgi:ABC-type multidrug transport system permease subunit
MEGRTWVWVWIGVAVVLIAFLLAIFLSLHANNPASSIPPTPVIAPQGQLVPQFPKSLILDSAAAISGSYSIGYSSSINQYTAEYDSSSTVTSLYNQYKTYLLQNGWTITGTLTSHPTFDVIGASQGANQLQVVISTQGKGSEVTVTYVVK